MRSSATTAFAGGLVAAVIGLLVTLVVAQFSETPWDLGEVMIVVASASFFAAFFAAFFSNRAP